MCWFLCMRFWHLGKYNEFRCFSCLFYYFRTLIPYSRARGKYLKALTSNCSINSNFQMCFPQHQLATKATESSVQLPRAKYTARHVSANSRCTIHVKSFWWVNRPSNNALHNVPRIANHTYRFYSIKVYCDCYQVRQRLITVFHTRFTTALETVSKYLFCLVTSQTNRFIKFKLGKQRVSVIHILANYTYVMKCFEMITSWRGFYSC